MTELTYLIDLLLNHDLKSETKKSIAERIKEVESNLVTRPVVGPRFAQAPSTIAAMTRHEMEAPPPAPILAPEIAQARQASMDMIKKNKLPPISSK